MKTRKAIVLLVFAIGVSQLPQAIAQNADDMFASGGAAFEAGDFARALSLFENARSAGSEGPAVHYNIGVCQYELGQYRQAEATFRSLAENFPAMRALAEYNVGLTLLRQNRDEAAIESFSYARDNSDDEKIIALANTALRRLTASDDADRVPGAGWAGLLDITVGHDDNVALIDESTIPTGQTADSPFVEFVAVITGPQTAGPGFRFDGSLYSVSYDDASQFDQTALRLGGFYRWRQNAWRFELGPYINRSTLDGDGFERQLGASLFLQRAIGSRGRLGIRVSHAEVDEISSRFTFISGSRERVSVSWDRFGPSGRLTLEYRLEENDRLDPSVSPSRNRLRLRHRYAINENLTLDAAVSLRQSAYDDLTVSRDEDRLEMSLGMVRALASRWEFRGTYLWSDNDSTLSQFSYSRSRISFGLTKNFGP